MKWGYVNKNHRAGLGKFHGLLLITGEKTIIEHRQEGRAVRSPAKSKSSAQKVDGGLAGRRHIQSKRRAAGSWTLPDCFKLFRWARRV